MRLGGIDWFEGSKQGIGALISEVDGVFSKPAEEELSVKVNGGSDM